MPALPKLNWGDNELRDRMLAVTRKWLAAPFDLDGWRIDVANMAGRFRAVDLNHSVARWLRGSNERWPQRTYLTVMGLDGRGRLLAPRDEPLTLEVRSDLPLLATLGNRWVIRGRDEPLPARRRKACSTGFMNVQQVAETGDPRLPISRRPLPSGRLGSP